jgi:GDP-L-fucose synthase
MENYNDSEIVNIGTGEDITIKDLAYLVKEVVGFKGNILFNSQMPNGTPRKLLDTTRLNNLGWTAKTKLKELIFKTSQIVWLFSKCERWKILSFTFPA